MRKEKKKANKFWKEEATKDGKTLGAKKGTKRLRHKTKLASPLLMKRESTKDGNDKKGKKLTFK
jgi:hypothetical protein